MDISLFRKADRFFGLFSIWSVQSSLDNQDACLPLMQCFPPPLIDSTTGQYNSTVTHNTSLRSAFLVSVQQGRDPERAFVALKYALRHLLELYRKPAKYRHLYILDTQWWSHGVHIIGGFYTIYRVLWTTKKVVKANAHIMCTEVRGSGSMLPQEILWNSGTLRLNLKTSKQ